MIYEYAVDPSLFTAEDTACFILESFGRDNGRLVSELKKDHWVNLVRAAIRTSGNKTVAKHTLKEALKILTKNNRALYCRQQQIEEGNWPTMTQQAHSGWPYRGILLEEYNGDEPQYLVRDIHLSGKSNWTAPTSKTVDREAAAMVAAVSALLENAREVILVDRNFRLENQHGSPVGKYKNVLLGIARFLSNKQYGPTVGKLVYHIGDQYYTAANLQTQFTSYLSADLPAGFRLEFAIWPKNDLHDRFILTDIGGIDCGIGLDEYAGSSERNVTFKRLSNTDHSREWSRFKQKIVDVAIP
ncbi:MAG: hypothetical protein U9O82_06525 [Thermodesulfobacteriota bacterium]|nr:hypothetical protein [Thermodesulfobacteriota bacterium]